MKTEKILLFGFDFLLLLFTFLPIVFGETFEKTPESINQIEKQAGNIHWEYLLLSLFFIFGTFFLMIFFNWQLKKKALKAHSALIKIEKNHQNLVNNLPIGIYRAEPGENGKVLMANPELFKMFGFSKKDTSLMNFMRVSDIYVNPDQRKYFSQILMQKKSVSGVELQLKKKDGSYIWVSVTAQITKDEDKIFFDGTVENINEKKKSQEKLRIAHQKISDILEFLPDPTFVIDEKKKVIAWNRAIEKMTGISKKDILGTRDHSYAIPFYGEKRKMLIDFLDQEDEIISEKYPKFKRIGNNISVEVFVPALNNNQGAYLLANASALLDTNGKIVGAIESLRDITQQKEYQKQLKKSYEKLKELDHAKDDFIAIASHELRTPMTVIRGYASMMLEDYDQEIPNEVKSQIRQIETNSKRLIEMVNDMLDIAKIESGSLTKTKVSEIQIEKVIQEIQDHFLPIAKEKNIIIQSCLPEKPLPKIFYNLEKLKQVFTNLIANAIKYIPKETGKIIISVEKEDNFLNIKIIDNGTGISKHYYQKIFEKFQVAESSIKKEKGTGLGLTICQQIVEFFGGKIWVQNSIEEGGAEFHFTVPTVLTEKNQKKEVKRTMKTFSLNNSISMKL